MNKKKLNSVRHQLGVPLASAVLALLFYFSGSLDSLEGGLYDLRFDMVRHATKASPEVAVILVDDASLQQLESELGRWPWTRGVFGELVDFLATGGARAVGFDVLFLEPERVCECGGQGGGDDRLAVAAQRFGGVFHAAVLTREPTTDFNRGRLNQALPDQLPGRFMLPPVEGTVPDDNSYYLPLARHLQSAAGVGVVEVKPDSDGRYRHLSLVRRYGEVHFPAMGIAPLIPELAVKSIRYTSSTLELDQLAVPVNGQGRLAINFYGHYATHSFAKVLESARRFAAGERDNLPLRPQDFQGKYVLVGTSAAGLADLKATPLDNRMPGVFIHAATLSNVLERDFMAETGPVAAVTGALLVALLCAVIWTLLPGGAVRVAGLLLVGVAVFFLSALRAYFNAMDPLAVSMATWLLTLLGLLIRTEMQSGQPAPGSGGLTGGVTGESGMVLCLLGSPAANSNAPVHGVLIESMRDVVRQHSGTVVASSWPELCAVWNSADSATVLAAVKLLQQRVAVIAGAQGPTVYAGLARGVYTVTGDGQGIYGSAVTEAHCAARVALKTDQELVYGASVADESREGVLLARLRAARDAEAMDFYRPLSRSERLGNGQGPMAPQEVWLEVHEHYAAQRWEEALGLLRMLPESAERQRMEARCRFWQHNGTPPQWDGTELISEW